MGLPTGVVYGLRPWRVRLLQLHRSKVLTPPRFSLYNRGLFAPRTPLNRPDGHAYQAAFLTVGLWRKKGGPSAASRKDANEGHFDLQQ